MKKRRAIPSRKEIKKEMAKRFNHHFVSALRKVLNDDRFRRIHSAVRSTVSVSVADGQPRHIRRAAFTVQYEDNFVEVAKMAVASGKLISASELHEAGAAALDSISSRV